MHGAARALTLVLSASLLLIGSGRGLSDPVSGVWAESRFQTGCDPGPYDPPPPPEHLETHYPPLGTSSQPASLQVSLDPPAEGNPTPMLGTGFNFEHALWSCPEFRGVFRSELLDPLMPAIARVDTGLLPAAP